MCCFNSFMLLFSGYLFTLLIAATAELQNIVFYFFFKIPFPVSDNTVISFHSHGRMGFSFLFYSCVTFEMNSDSPEDGPTVQKDFKCTK